MWLFTRFGFFSIVRKVDGKDLTIRSRTKGDLDRLRNHYLPTLSPARQHEGTDYPWRAIASDNELTQAMKIIVEDIDYPNFKDEVAFGLGKDRAGRYAQVWLALYGMSEDLAEPQAKGFEGLSWPQSTDKGKVIAYGGVVVDPNGFLLLREMKNHFDGYVWTFAKGQSKSGESPRETALREVQKKMGVTPTIINPIAGEFAGGNSINRFFLMVIDKDEVALDYQNQVTNRLHWAAPAEVEKLISQTTNKKGRERDLLIHRALRASLPEPLPLRRPIARRTDWINKPLPAARLTLPLETRYSQQEMAIIVRGYIPNVMEEKWFIFYEDGILHCHRSWTGICIYRVYFKPTIDGWQAWQVEINRHPEQYSETDQREDMALLDSIIEHLLIFGPTEPTVDGFAEALKLAAKPGYLGSPQIVGELLKELFVSTVEEHKGNIQGPRSSEVIHKLSVIFSEDTENYTRMPEWHNEHQLGKVLVRVFNLDEDYCQDENLCFLVVEGLSALKSKIDEMMKAFYIDDAAQWERDALPQLNELHNFATAVLLGTNGVTYQDTTLREFTWKKVTASE